VELMAHSLPAKESFEVTDAHKDLLEQFCNAENFDHCSL
jgi:hypothetical protein